MAVTVQQIKRPHGHISQRLHLDLEAITAVNNGLTAFKGIVLFTSHDHEFIQTVANRIIVIEKTGIKDITSSYDEYIEANRIIKN